MNSVWFISACIQEEIHRKMECKITRCLVTAPPIGSLHAICSTSIRGSGSTAPEPNIQVPTPECRVGVRGQSYLYSTPLWLESKKHWLRLSLTGLGFSFQRREGCTTWSFDIYSCTCMWKWKPLIYFHRPIFDPQSPMTLAATEHGKIGIMV